MMFGISVEFLLNLIQQHGTLAVMLGMVVEEVFVPIPSPIIPMAAGSIIIDSSLSVPMALIQIFFRIAIPASIASVVSSYFVYSIAYIGGEPLVKKYGRWLDIEWRDVENIEEYFGDEREKYYVALFRSVPIVPLSLVSGAAGLFRMDWRQYGIWTFIGMMPRNFLLAFLGWYLSDSFHIVASQIDSASTAVALSIVVIVVGFIAYRKTKELYRYILREL